MSISIIKGVQPKIVPDINSISLAKVALGKLFGTGHVRYHEMGLMVLIEVG